MHTKHPTPVRLKSVALLILITVFSTAESRYTYAQAPGFKPDVNLYFGAGHTSVVSPDLVNDLWDHEYSLTAGLGVALAPGFEIVLKYQRFNFTPSNMAGALPTQIELRDAAYTLLGADAKFGLLPLPLPIKPYFTLGAGKQNYTNGDLSTFAGRGENFFIGVGGGADLTLSPRVGAFIEAKYLLLNTSQEAVGLFPVLFGVRLF